MTYRPTLHCRLTRHYSIHCLFPHLAFYPTIILPSLVNNMKYVVFGGGGQVALHFAKTAIGKGHQVISVVRDDSQ
jgi:hypothetical protein